jgi:WD40 repeat protein
MIFVDRWHPTGVSFVSENEDIFAVSGGANYGIKGDGGVKLFNRQKQVWEWSTPNSLYDVKGNEELIFAAGKNGSIYVLDHQKKLKKTLSAHAKEIDRLALYNRMRLLASCSWDGYLKLWDIKMMKLILSIKPAINLNVAVNEASFSPDGNLIACVCMEGPMTIWDVRNWQRINQIPARSSFLTIDWSQDGRHIAVGGVDHNIYVYEPFSTHKAEMVLNGHYESVRQLRWINNTKLMSVGYDMNVRWWDIHALNPLIKLDSSFTEFVVCCDVQRGTGRQIAGCWDRTIRTFYN